MAYISITSKSDLSKKWYSLLNKRLPSGVILPKDGYVMKKSGDTLTVFLTRDLTQTEITDISNSFKCEDDYDIKASSSIVYTPQNNVVKVKKTDLNELLEKWSKRKHDTWMKNKLENGWKYSGTYSDEKKTHPLLRTWNDLPSEYRKTDITEFQEMIKFINDCGYIISPSA